MYAATLMLKSLKAGRYVSFDKLLSVVKKATDCDYVLFMPAINLLYLLGLVEYHQTNDSFEYIGK
ncbi:hypothetical protein HMPREF9952_0800 [Haemophilus pittmaniae HK 85]|uniref:Uncharacterized protein n=2 Tax=Haemophilus pittmaniae TaxID=249188 RepID=F9Q9U7_9PAST|nr:hypothetical protein HMPREF9952_0800 [Haemophilus pittmaniae HK 85]